VVAGGLHLHRKVVVLGGTVAMWVAVVTLIVITELVSPIVGVRPRANRAGALCALARCTSQQPASGSPTAPIGRVARFSRG
jgi:hypothetical protein